MIHEDDKEYTGGGMFIAYVECYFVKPSLNPAIEDEEIQLEDRDVWKRAIGWIIAERFIHIGDGIIDKIIEPPFRLLRQREAVQVAWSLSSMCTK